MDYNDLPFRKRLRRRIRKLRYFFRQYVALAKVYLRRHKKISPKKHGLSHPIIISVKSYRPRFATLHYTLECLLRQSVPADSVILWIDPEDFDQLPNEVLALKKLGLEIIQTPYNQRSYGKIIPALMSYPDAIIITTDDDTYYQENFLELMLNAWSGNKNEIVCHTAFHITKDENGTVQPFLLWAPVTSETKPSIDIIPFGAGGIMYPPDALPLETLDETKFMELCPSADDLWLYWMGRKNGCTYRRIAGHAWIVAWPWTQEEALHHDNNTGGNDRQINNLIEAYGIPDQFSIQNR